MNVLQVAGVPKLMDLGPTLIKCLAFAIQ